MIFFVIGQAERAPSSVCFGWNYIYIIFIYIRCTVRRSYAHAPILCALTNSGPGPGVQFTSCNDTASVPRRTPGCRKSSRQRGLCFSVTITRSRACKATILLLFQKVDRKNAQLAKVLTTERLVFSATIKRWRAGAGKAASGYTLPVRCYFFLVVSLHMRKVPY